MITKNYGQVVLVENKNVSATHNVIIMIIEIMMDITKMVIIYMENVSNKQLMTWHHKLSQSLPLIVQKIVIALFKIIFGIKISLTMLVYFLEKLIYLNNNMSHKFHKYIIIILMIILQLKCNNMVIKVNVLYLQVILDVIL